MAGQIRIMHLMNGFADASIGRIVQKLIHYLGTNYYDWHIAGLCGLGEMREDYQQMGVRVVDFSISGNGVKKQADHIRKYIYANKIQIVHTHTIRTIMITAWALGLQSPIIHVATKHTLTNPKQRKYGLIYAMIDRASLYLPDHLVAVSQTMEKQLQRVLWSNSKRVSIIRNGIDFHTYDIPDMRSSFREEYDFHPLDLVVLFIGRLVITKHVDLLIRGFANVHALYPQIKLVIVGEGEERPRLETLVNQLGITKAVKWTGFRKDIPRILAGADIFVQPSINEGLSLSLLEAMAAGKAVIATNVGGTGEVLRDRRNGILIPPNSLRSLIFALKELLENNSLRASIAGEGRETVRTSFDIPQMIEAYKDLYNNFCFHHDKPASIDSMSIIR